MNIFEEFIMEYRATPKLRQDVLFVGKALDKAKTTKPSSVEQGKALKDVAAFLNAMSINQSLRNAGHDTVARDAERSREYRREYEQDNISTQHFDDFLSDIEQTGHGLVDQGFEMNVSDTEKKYSARQVK